MPILLPGVCCLCDLSPELSLSEPMPLFNLTLHSGPGQWLALNCRVQWNHQDVSSRPRHLKCPAAPVPKCLGRPELPYKKAVTLWGNHKERTHGKHKPLRPNGRKEHS